MTKNCAKEDEGKNENRKKKLEVRLEREIVGINWPDGEDWFNQVPVASGLINDRSDKRRAIDLVHQREDGSYEFIELKVDSDTPLYAAMEILQYAILYMFARRNERIRGAASEKRLLEATAIHLRVLAPCHYYNGYEQLDRLEDEICKGINRFLEREKITLQMDFAFEAFPADFKLHKLGRFPNADAIVQALRRVEALK